MMLEVSHRTTYSYGRPVLRSQHLVYMTPRPGLRQAVHWHGLLIEPAPSGNVSVEDYFGNRSAVLTIEERHSELVIQARSTVEVQAGELPKFETTTAWARCRPRRWARAERSTSACCSSRPPRATRGPCAPRSTMRGRRLPRVGRSWIPEAGWVDFDPTSGLMPGDEHITVAYGRDFADVSPVSGVLLGGGRQRIDVAVDVAVLRGRSP